jgi:hypothetical protein
VPRGAPVWRVASPRARVCIRLLQVRVYLAKLFATRSEQLDLQPRYMEAVRVATQRWKASLLGCGGDSGDGELDRRRSNACAVPSRCAGSVLGSQGVRVSTPLKAVGKRLRLSQESSTEPM